MSLATLHDNRHARNAERGRSANTVSATLALIIALMVKPAILIRCRHRCSGHAHILGRDHTSVIENNTPRVSELAR